MIYFHNDLADSEFKELEDAKDVPGMKPFSFLCWIMENNRF